LNCSVAKSSTEEISMSPLRYMPCFFCSCSASPAARSVPYDSPHRNFGDIHRPLRAVHSRMISVMESMSGW
jgi:hypothetical protein